MLGNFFSSSKSETLATLFSYPDGSACQQPCILGIQPGLTKPNQVIELITAHPYTKGNEIQQGQHGGQDYISVALEKNSLQVKVDYKTNQVSEVNLEGDGINGLGIIGIDVNGTKIKWNDIISYLGSPEVVTAASGDGGMISLAAGLYNDGWCIYARPIDDFPPIIPPDGEIIRIGINCYLFKDLGDSK
jgi:hypothetical protein